MSLIYMDTNKYMNKIKWQLKELLMFILFNYHHYISTSYVSYHMQEKAWSSLSHLFPYDCLFYLSSEVIVHVYLFCLIIVVICPFFLCFSSHAGKSLTFVLFLISGFLSPLKQLYIPFLYHHYLLTFFISHHMQEKAWSLTFVVITISGFLPPLK